MIVQVVSVPMSLTSISKNHACEFWFCTSTHVSVAGHKALSASLVTSHTRWPPSSPFKKQQPSDINGLHPLRNQLLHASKHVYNLSNLGINGLEMESMCITTMLPGLCSSKVVNSGIYSPLESQTTLSLTTWVPKKGKTYKPFIHLVFVSHHE